MATPNDEEDTLPVEDVYQAQYDRREAQAHAENMQLIDEPISLSLTHQETPEEAARREAAAAPTPIESTAEALARTADLAKKLPQIREQLTGDVKDTSLRGILNSALSTVTGGVLSLDDVDAHLKALVEGKPSPLAEKLSSIPALMRIADPAGNVMEAVARRNATEQGLSPEIIDRVSSTAGMLGGVLTPGITGKQGARVATKVFQNSLFSNPATHAANMASNALTSTWAIPERFFAATWSAAEYAATLGAHKRTVFFGEPGAMLIGGLHTSIDSIRGAGHALRTGEYPMASIAEDVVGAGRHPRDFSYLAGGIRPVDKDLVENGVIQQGNGFFHNIMDMVTGGAGAAGVGTLPVRALAAEDVAAKIINYNMERYALAYRKLARNDRNITYTNIKKVLETPNSRTDLRSFQFATAATFQRELEELGPIYNALGHSLQAVQDISFGSIPLGRLAVPVLRTPMNLAHFTLERSPGLNLLSSTWRKDFAAGGALRATAMGKVTGGAVLASSAVYLANAGIITGGGPSDPNLRRQMQELTGWQPFSLHIGDTYYQINRLGPVGALLGISATYAEIGGSLSEDKLSRIGQAIGLGTSQYVQSNQFVKGMADVMEALAGDKQALARLVSANIVSELTPGVVRTIRKGFDPVKREIEPGAALEPGVFNELRVHLNKLQMETPGWSRSLPPVRNLWGDPVMLPSGFGPDWISPVYTTTENKDPAGSEIVRLGLKGLPVPGRAPRVILGQDPDSRPVDLPVSPFDIGIQLTDLEYDEFVQLAGNELKSNGRGMHDRMNDMIASEAYGKAKDEKRALMIMNVVTNYRKAAISKLIKNNPGILDTYKAQARAKGAAITGARPEPQQQMVPFKGTAQ